MTVTSQDKGRAGTTAKAGTMTRKNPATRRNAQAAALADPRYRARVVGSDKVYSRQKKAKLGEGDDA